MLMGGEPILPNKMKPYQEIDRDIESITCFYSAKQRLSHFIHLGVLDHLRDGLNEVSNEP